MNNEQLFSQSKFQELYEQNIKFIYSLANKYRIFDREEIISAANVGFAKAINSYSINKNTKFITYASICMNNEILMYIRKNNKLKNQISIYNLLNADLDGNKLMLEDLLADPNNFVEDLESKEDIDILKKAINKLPDKMKKIIELRLNNKTQKEIAKVLNVTSSYISRLEKKLLKD